MTTLKTPDGTSLSPLAFGTMQFGGKADEDDAKALYRLCRSRGINHFDTAHAYTDGASERMLGALVAEERDAIFVATKAAFKDGNGRGSIEASLTESLERLKIDAIDLYYLHRWDPDTDLRETFEALAKAQRAGRIRHIGVSNFAAWQVMKAQAVAKELGTRIDAIQPMLNLVKRQAEVEIIPMAMDQGIAVFPYSPLGGGLLTGKYRAGETGRLTESDMYANRYGEDWMHNAAADLAVLARRLRTDPATMAVAWAMERPGVTAPIVSARSAAQLAPSLAALDLGMTGDLYAQVTALGRTPPSATDRTEE